MIFFEKCFSFYILITDQVSLPDLFYFLRYEILDNMSLLTRLWDIYSEISFIFLIKQFFYMTKKSRQILKYFENKNSFQGELKSIFQHFQRALRCQKLSQTWECAFKSPWKVFIPVLSNGHKPALSNKIYYVNDKKFI